MATSSPPLSETHPELLKLWDYELNDAAGFKTNKVQAGSAKPIHWKHWHETTLPNGETWQGWHKWTRNPNSQKNVKPEFTCLICSGKQILKGYNDLFTKFPHLEKEWDWDKNKKAGYDPYKLTYGSKTPVYWKHWHETTLINGEKWAGWHEWEMAPNARTNASKTQSCPICGKTKLLKGYNDLQTTHPKLMNEWDWDKNNALNVKPDEIFAGTHDYIHWKCVKDHQWKAKAYARAYIGSGCPTCKGTTVEPGRNDLETKYPHIAEQWHPTKNKKLKPSEFLPSSGTKVWWQHTTDDGKTHEWYTPICYRTANQQKRRVNGEAYEGDGCPVCLNRRLIPGVNDLATLNPEIAALWHPTHNKTITPEGVMTGGTTQYWWKHETDEKVAHEWKATPSQVIDNQGCIRCLKGSIAEREIADFLSKKLDLTIHTGTRKIISNELDIYIPEKNIAIEFNGIYWHSEYTGKGKWYHKNKHDECQEKGIQLIQIWEDDWKNRKEFIKLALLHKLQEVDPQLRTGARKLKPIQINYQQASEFLNKNHIQGEIQGSCYYALSTKNDIKDIKAVLVIKKVGNKGHEGEWRIERYATSIPVAGGFTKLLKHAEDELKLNNKTITQWVTFSDNCISDGGLYSNNGFTKDKDVAPDYMYVKNGKRIHKFNYRLKRFREDPTLQWKENLSESQLAKLNNLHRIWDAGKIRWIKQV